MLMQYKGSSLSGFSYILMTEHHLIKYIKLTRMVHKIRFDSLTDIQCNTVAFACVCVLIAYYGSVKTRSELVLLYYSYFLCVCGKTKALKSITFYSSSSKFISRYKILIILMY